MPLIGASGAVVNVAAVADMAVTVPVASEMAVTVPVARVVSAPGGGSGGAGVAVASVVLYCPTLTEENLTPTDGDLMYWVEWTPELDNPDPMTGLGDWTGREEFPWSEGWADDNDPTNVLMLVGDETWMPSVLAEVTPTGFEAIPVLGGQPVVVGCGGGGPDFTGSLWTGWNIGSGQGGAPDPTQPAMFVVPPSVTADAVRIIDRTGNGSHTTLADWIANLDVLTAADKDIAGGVAGLDGDGKIATSTLPALAIGDTFPVASEAAMLALDVQRGDVAIRADLTASFILSGDDPTVLADWLQMSWAGDVASVNGQTGVIVLGYADVGAASAAQGALADTAVQPGDLPTLAELGGAPPAAFYVAGNHYPPPGILSGGTRIVPTGGTCAIPVRIGKACTINGLQIDVSSAGSAGLAADLHLMAAGATGFPAASVFVVDVTTTGTGTQILANTATGVQVAPGLYWAVVHNRSAGSITVRSVSSACHIEPMPAQTSTSGNQLSGYTATPGTSAITSHPALGSSTGVNSAAIVSFRVSAV